MNVEFTIINGIDNIVFFVFTITWLQRYFDHLQLQCYLQLEQLIFNSCNIVISAYALITLFNSPVQR